MIYALPDTQKALGGKKLPKCESRSLFQSRFADPEAKDDKDATPRRDWFNSLIGSQRKAFPAPGRHDWLPPRAVVLYARLMGRLMVNMSGGTMTNANTHLDRLGLPCIPGSAVKGCARRMALQALRDWVTEEATSSSGETISTPCRKDFSRPADLLAAIARVFGWVEQDWKKDSDLAWACGDNYKEIWCRACEALLQRFGKGIPEGQDPWDALPDFGGTIAFLAASPNCDPGLVLDVLTPHHKEYYEGKMDVALDTEDAVPVFFPALKPQNESDFFAFPLIPLPRGEANDGALARLWLGQGLELFGLGAKTAAGYGWFDASEQFNSRIAKSLAERQERERADRDRKAQEALQAAEEEAKRAAKEKLRQELAALSPDELADRKIALLNDTQFETKMVAFCKEPKKGGPTEDEKKAMVRALRKSRAAYWESFKARATKGPLATVQQAIRTLNRTLHGDKMP